MLDSYLVDLVLGTNLKDVYGVYEEPDGSRTLSLYGSFDSHAEARAFIKGFMSYFYDRECIHLDKEVML